MHRACTALIFLLALLGLSAAGSVQGQSQSIPALDFSGLGRGFNYTQGSYSLGWTFKTSAALRVTALGFYDDLKNGLTQSHPVALYDLDEKRMVATTTVLPSDPLTGFFHYRSIAPVTLRAGGMYAIQGVTGTERYAIDVNIVTLHPAITFTGVALVEDPTATQVMYPTSFMGTIFGSPLPSDFHGDFGPNLMVVAAGSSQAPDLVGAGLSYRVPADRQRLSNGPLPVNEPFDAQAVVRNTGPGAADAGEVAFYLSRDETIDPDTDLLLGTAALPALASGETRTVEATLNEDARILADESYTGVVWLGTVIDPEDQLPEGNEGNNSNVGRLVDRRPVELFDRTLAPVTLPGTFPTRARAEQALRRSGFRFVCNTEMGWSKSTPAPTRSRRNGMSMPAGAFRVFADVTSVRGASRKATWSIRVRGEDSAGVPLTSLDLPPGAVGEPNPRRPDGPRAWGADFGPADGYVFRYYFHF